MELRDRLRMAAVKQKFVAQQAGVSEATVSRALSGERALTPRVAQAAEDAIRDQVAQAAQALVGGDARGR